jgi:uncharacterized protein
MSPVMTERFELRPDPSLLERLDEWRTGQEGLPSRAEAIRTLVESGFNKPEKSFSPRGSEKLILWMLAEIMKRQKEPSKDPEKRTIDLIQDVIYGGHYWALEWELSGIFDPSVDKRESVSLVVGVLTMWDFIEQAYKGFSPADKALLEEEVEYLGKDPKFEGFDGNDETEFMSIARFLVEKLERFLRFKGRELNSHMPTVHRYQRMSREFEKLLPNLLGRQLNVQDVISLLSLQRRGA